MRLTKAGEYAIRCSLYLAKAKPGVVVNRREIAEAMDIPYQFLGKVAQLLARAGLIQITQGARGGCRLARSADLITLLDVVEAVEGDITLNECLAGPGVCNRAPGCAVHQVWALAQDAMRQVLGAATLAEMARGTVLPLAP